MTGDEREAPVPRPAGASRYGWFLGVVVVLLIAVVTLNTAVSRHASSEGPPVGQPLPPFAVPLALSDLVGDANVATRGNAGSAGRVPACRLRGPRILNVCQLAERGPVALAFLATRGGNCTGELDRLDALRGRFAGLQVAAVAIRGDRQGLRTLIRGHGWGFPVGYDSDGVLANLYGVAVCPQITLAYPGRGVVRANLVGQHTAAALGRELAALVAESRRRGWRPPAPR